MLSTGSYPMQSRLPPERELASQLGLSRSALREGLELLEAEGRIWRHVGKGTFVGERPLHGSVDLNLLSEVTNPEEVIEVRLLFEPLIAGLAALRATPAEIAHLEHLLEKSEAARDAVAWERWDTALHRAVAQAARNKLLLAIFDAFNGMRRQAAWGKLRGETLTLDRLSLYRAHHREYVAAIADRDGPRAEQAMRRHLQTVRDNLLNASAVRPAPVEPAGAPIAQPRHAAIEKRMGGNG
ncbi:GntR family transcriptional regulator [Hypericibacter adhaerens]|uniref:GntR family transcriptional regulator n=1 Tax=Hypericibacter adhaerens TaxID=2602016 RepID=A0A5J6N0A3_9PROT|nr:GntR family transcriptional regulator [Hypericibacter adhaerens]